MLVYLTFQEKMLLGLVSFTVLKTGVVAAVRQHTPRQRHLCEQPGLPQRDSLSQEDSSRPAWATE